MDPIAAFGQSFWGEGTTRLSVEVSQSLYTPHDTQLDPPNPFDRPYAGVLLLTGGMIHDGASTRDIFDVSVGVVGPVALGEALQNGFHSLISNTANRGWHYQVGNQPAFNILAQRTYRWELGQAGPVQFDVLPSAALAGGDVRTYAQLGSVVRFGQGLTSDFGTARIEPGISGSDAFTPTRRFVWYGFAGVMARRLGYDVTLDGSTFRMIHFMWADLDVGEIEAGAAVIAYGLRLTYTQTWQTQEFHGARSGLFNFGSVALSVRF